MTLKFDGYDKRNYKTLSTREGYARWSAVYDDGMTAMMDTDLLRRLDLDWGTVGAAVDLACGTGRIGRWLRERGAPIVDGVDFSPEMIEGARRKGEYRELRCEDIEGCGFSGPYDLATCSLACEHFEDLGVIYKEAARLVRPGGHFVHIAYHPVFLLRGIPTHFLDPSGEDIAIESHIHLFSDHVSAGRAHGWELVAADERIVDDDLVAEHPPWVKHQGWPLSLLLAWRRR